MTMHCPTPNLSHAAEDLKDLHASGWGQKDLAREIELLEAVVRRDQVHDIIDSAISAIEDSCTAESKSNCGTSRDNQYDSSSIRVIKGLDAVRLRRSLRLYIDDAISTSIVSIHEEIEFFRGVSNRLRVAYGGYLSIAMAQRLGIATGLLRLVAVLRVASVEQLKLEVLALAAFLRIPLFSYGPELSWFRHRLRLTLA